MGIWEYEKTISKKAFALSSEWLHLNRKTVPISLLFFLFASSGVYWFAGWQVLMEAWVWIGCGAFGTYIVTYLVSRVVAPVHLEQAHYMEKKKFKFKDFGT